MVNNCKHLIEDSQQVPTPFGIGTVSEPLLDCRIESESEECDENCKDYEPKKTELEKAAKKAARTGNRTDLQAYLKMRRNYR